MDDKKIEKDNSGEGILTVLSIIIIWIGLFIWFDKHGLPYVFIFGVSTVVFSSMCKRVARAKGITGGYCIGWFLSVVGLLAICAMPEKNINKDEKQQKSNNGSDKYDRIKKIQELKESGALTEEEFNREKKKILNEKD